MSKEEAESLEKQDRIDRGEEVEDEAPDEEEDEFEDDDEEEEEPVD
jgi:hypothetical protein